MKLAVATICSHLWYEDAWWSYQPYVLEMDIWCSLFEELVMIAPIEDGPPPPFWTSYKQSSKISVVPYMKNGGKGLEQRKTFVKDIPRMLRAIMIAARRTDAFHVRSPGSIGLLASLLAPLIHTRVCAKYAGAWVDLPSEPLTVRLQKRILRSRWFSGPVTVYGQWPKQPKHIVPFFTSVMTEEEMERARRASLKQRIKKEINILFVGRLTYSKNVHVIIDSISMLRKLGIKARLTVVGDGPELFLLKERAEKAYVTDFIVFTGAVAMRDVFTYYEEADVLVLASETEGWPKALAEGMAFGLVCVASNRGLIPWMLSDERGILVEPGESCALVNAISSIVRSPEPHRMMAIRAAAWAQQFTLNGLRNALNILLNQWWDVRLINESVTSIL
jgi:glycosyltransferase involved in cell wall biosynthesis